MTVNARIRRAVLAGGAVAALVLAAPSVSALPPAAVASGPGAAAAPRPIYRAIGDSYAAGYALSGAKGCARSVKAYPVLLSRTTLKQFTLQFRACSGATTQQIAARQLGPRAANGGVRIVTVSAGGNDIGFGAIATCSPDVNACEAAIKHGLALEASGVIQRKIHALLVKVHAAMPNAKIFVLDYPVAIQHTRSRAGCDTATQLAIQLFGAQLDQLNTGLNTAIHGAVHQVGLANEHVAHPVRIAEVRSMVAAFAGHGMCSPTNWIGRPGSTSPLHPTAVGQARLAAAVRRQL